MLSLLPLALGSAVYPTLLAMVIVILGRPEPRPLLAAYLAGAMLTSLTVGVLIVGALNAGNVVGGDDHTVSPAVDIVGGLIALLLFWLLLTDRDRRLREHHRRRKPEPSGDRDPWSQRVLSRNSAMLTFVVGMALNLPGALYLVALKDIAAADQGTGAAVAQIVFYNLIMFTWAEIPLVGYSIAPERTRELIERMSAWLGGHSRRIAMALCGAAAAFLLTRGLIEAIH